MRPGHGFVRREAAVAFTADYFESCQSLNLPLSLIPAHIPEGTEEFASFLIKTKGIQGQQGLFGSHPALPAIFTMLESAVFQCIIHKSIADRTAVLDEARVVWADSKRTKSDQHLRTALAVGRLAAFVTSICTLELRKTQHRLFHSGSYFRLFRVVGKGHQCHGSYIRVGVRRWIGSKCKTSVSKLSGKDEPDIILS
ncbi:hypothetical protein SDC9_128361 [bioreactor metagenome]|uniref:Uncharacterized protein n=1 Tax=bioreactor metagenome TaxID=1076179 RepID=A0A645CWM3_9ZZZZ